MAALVLDRSLVVLAFVQKDIASETYAACPEFIEHIDAVIFLYVDMSDFAERDESEPEQILRELPQIEQREENSWDVRLDWGYGWVRVKKSRARCAA